MKKAAKKVTTPSMADIARVSQHHRMATGNMGTVNKPVDKVVPKKSGGKVGKCK